MSNISFRDVRSYESKPVCIPGERMKNNGCDMRESLEDARRRLGLVPTLRGSNAYRQEPQHVTYWSSSPVQGGGWNSTSPRGALPFTTWRRDSVSEDDQTRQPLVQKACAFCKSNGEVFNVYSSHYLKDARGKITCPILRRYSCRVCGATGDDAHTDSYCPFNAPKRSMKVLLTTTKSSTGIRNRVNFPH